jgi:hypothetical protein
LGKIRNGVAFPSGMNVPLLVLLLASSPVHAVSLADYAKAHPLTTWTATKGATMPSTTDQTNNLKEGDRALLLSGKEIDDLTGISTLMVEDEGKTVPLATLRNVHLFLNRNRITALPDEMEKLAGVNFLYLEYNRLSMLPTALARMAGLQGMYFTANRFTKIPPFVFGMTRLKKLQFAKNAITTLPAELGNLTELMHLNMSANKFPEVPASIAKLTKLRVCDLSDNPIRSLPEEFGKVQIMHQLRVRNTLLTSLPAGFATMHATIDVTGSKIDPEKLPPGLRAKLDTAKAPGSNANITVKRPEKK